MKILPMDSFAAIVADSYFLESEIYVSQWKHDSKDYSTAKYALFFEQHGLTQEAYLYNVRFYFSHKKYADRLIAKVDELVEQRVAALRDSLNREQ
jgi:hypothetical protein